MDTQKYHICFAGLFLFFTLSVLLNTSAAQASGSDTKFFATSAGINPNGRTHIVLYWEKAKDIVGYNLYRKKSGDGDYPNTPINGQKLITIVANCDELKTFIPEGSKVWQMMEDAFAAAYFSKGTANKIKKMETGNFVSIDQGEMLLKRGIIIDAPQLILFDKTKNLCAAFERGLNEKEQSVFEMIALLNLKCRRAAGLAFIDEKVQQGQVYLYQLRGVDSKGDETILPPDVVITAGIFSLPEPPDCLTLIAGDSKILCLWDHKEHYSYVVSRSTCEKGIYNIVNQEPIIFDIVKDIDGNNLEPQKPGFLDFRRWDEEGEPTSHEVNGRTISGPENNEEYYYKVACVDILGRAGAWSSSLSATPRDTTPPSAPGNFRIDVSPSQPHLILTWEKVTGDVKGHKEQDTLHTYYIFRSESLEQMGDIDNLNESSEYMVASLTANPTAPDKTQLTWTDTAAILVPAYGEKDFYYRIRCEDSGNNLSAPSAAISGRVPDRTPPGLTQVVDSEGTSSSIKIFWLPNSEPDLAGYQVYRGICANGEPYQPGIGTDGKIKLPCEYVLIGQVLREDAKEMFENTGRVQFSDDSVPKGSPICYSYWVRAFDESRNIYYGEDDSGCPGEDQFLCQRLYEENPPPVPVITSVKARNNAVQLGWVSSPVQDLRCFHVYRSKEEMITENSPLEFVACVYIDGTYSSTTKWEGIDKPSCQDIPARLDPDSAKVSFTDKNIKPNTIYWYRISALDWLGNESEGANITEIPAISTFTYSKDLPMTPVLLPPAKVNQEGRGRVIRWDPIFDASKLSGFIVFRSSTAYGIYRQVSPVVQDNEFTDSSAFQGKNYWYRVQSINKYGKLSESSAPQKY